MEKQTADKPLDARLAEYRAWLLSLKILDPACGSGAFLNAALKQLRKEHALLESYWSRLHPGELYFDGIDNAILENNLYGVDINEESVEIAKLSLWLSTAKRNRKLSTLANNIKCGNSLISDKAIAGEKAFDWQKEFPQVFARPCVTVTNGAQSETGNPYDNESCPEARTGIVTVTNAAQSESGIPYDNESRPEEKTPNVMVTNAAQDKGGNRYADEACPARTAEIVTVTRGEQHAAAGGFDVVIGNPPYVRVQNLKNADVDYYFSHYKTPCGKLDISILFFERCFSLLKPNGFLSFISTSQWLQTEYGKNIRNFLLDGKIKEIMDFGSLPVFRDADTYPAIFTLTKEPANTFLYKKVPSAFDLEIGRLKAIGGKKCAISEFSEKAWQFSGFNLLNHLQKTKTSFKQLKDIAPSYIGCLTGKDEAFVLPTEKVEELKLEKELIFPYAYRGEEVYAYSLAVPAASVIYPYNQDGSLIDEEELKSKYPNIYSYLLQFKSILEKRLDSRKLYAMGKNWFKLVRPGQFSYILPKKILLKGIGLKMTAALLGEGTAFNGSNVPAVVLPQEENLDKALLCILNSKLISYYMTSICPKKLGGYYRFNSTNISSIPIPALPHEAQQPLIALADKMLSLTADLQKKCARFISRIKETYSPQKITQNLESFYNLSFADFAKELAKQKVKLSLKQKDELEDYFSDYVKEISALREQIATTDREINAAVYALYGLTEEEIAVVEKS